MADADQDTNLGSQKEESSTAGAEEPHYNYKVILKPQLRDPGQRARLQSAVTFLPARNASPATIRPFYNLLLYIATPTPFLGDYLESTKLR